MFDDPIVEIQELTALIKDDITAVNMDLSDLQALQNLEIAEGNYFQDRVVHWTKVCDDLKSKLMGATKELQDVNIKAHENRKQIFSANALRDSPFRQQAKPVTEPSPWPSPVNASEFTTISTKGGCGQPVITPAGSSAARELLLTKSGSCSSQ